MIDKENPCTKDCPDRPNCKGCERGNAWRNRKIAQDKEKRPEFDFKLYETNQYKKRQKAAHKFKKGVIK